MKITFLVPNIEISGGNRANFELADALVELGHEVTVVYPLIPGRDGLGWLNLRKTAVQVVKGCRNLIGNLEWFPLKANLSSVSYVSKAVLAKDLPDADFLIFSWWAHCQSALELPARCGTPIHLIRSMEFWGGPKALVCAAYQLSLDKFVTSDYLKAQYESEFGAVNGLVPDGVNTNLFNPGSADNKDSVVVGMVYRSQLWKRMGDGLEALARVQAQHPEVRIKLFGESIRSRDKAALGALNHVEYEHLPSGERLRDLYRSLDIFLSPSGKEEAFGLPALEAMACGCAVVATKVGAVETYSSDEKTALHCDPGNVEQLTLAINRLLEDVTLRAELGAKAAEQAKEFGWRASAQALLNQLPG